MNLKSFFNSNKTVLTIFLIVLLTVLIAATGYGGYRLYCFLFPKPHASIAFALQKTKDIDKLYTGVYLVPVVDLQWGTLKRDTWKIFSEDKEVVKAYCLKKYEVYVGYDNITDLLSDQKLIENVCTGRTDKLPEPQILAVKPLPGSGPSAKYDVNGPCYKWDSNERQRKDILMTTMHNGSNLEKINKHGRASLKSLASLFCE